MLIPLPRKAFLPYLGGQLEIYFNEMSSQAELGDFNFLAR